jgi:Peptidase family M28
VPRRRLRWALSLDEVGTSARLRLRSPVAAPRRGVERELLRAAIPAGARLDWQRDSGSGNSDHRELELAGRPAMKLGGLDNPCRHEACDTPQRLRKGAFRAVVRLLGRVL